ncbi:hypothetical protein ACXR0O_10295 [Verrucomicrobiota bacterium sgz303538]
MKSLYLFAAVAALGLSACDSRQENARENALEKRADGLENQADATRKASEKKADAIESSGKHGVDKLNPNTPADKEADAVRKSGEAKADALENKADAVRDQK